MTLCIYHGNCADGFGAAWVVRERFKRDGMPVDFFAGIYQDPPPNVAGQHVILVDFSYKRDVLAEMAEDAASILIIDHHKTAAADLRDIEEAPPWEYLIEHDIPRLAAVFDMNRSGAGLAWDYFFAGQSRPRLIDHIEDRDLWKFSLPGTRPIQAALFSFEYSFDIWDHLMRCDPATLLAEGSAIERKHHKDIAELVAVCKRPMKIGGAIVPAASLPYTLTSDAGHLMAADAPFAACYYDTPEGRCFSLRSREDGADVSEIAKQYGGGGHKHAAGFRVPFSRLVEFEP